MKFILKELVSKIDSKIQAIPVKSINFKFRIKLELKQQIGRTGLNNNHFTEPNDITTDNYMNIIVADSNSNYMKVFNSNGEFQFKFCRIQITFSK